MAALDTLLTLKARMGESIIGQERVVERLLIALLANGNVLIEGLPGLAKTRAVKSLANNLQADYSRIQFTPDLLPSDITGTEVLHRGADGNTFCRRLEGKALHLEQPQSVVLECPLAGVSSDRILSLTQGTRHPP